VATSVAVVAVGAVVSGVAGVIVVGAALGDRYVLRNRTKLLDGITVGVRAGGLILAGTVCRRTRGGRWTATPGTPRASKLLALISVGALAASICPTIGSPPDRRPDWTPSGARDLACTGTLRHVRDGDHRRRDPPRRALEPENMDAAVDMAAQVLHATDRSEERLYRGAAGTVLVTSLLRAMAEGDRTRAQRRSRG
jgi:hypothetical protein